MVLVPALTLIPSTDVAVLLPLIQLKNVMELPKDDDELLPISTEVEVEELTMPLTPPVPLLDKVFPYPPITLACTVGLPVLAKLIPVIIEAPVALGMLIARIVLVEIVKAPVVFILKPVKAGVVVLVRLKLETVLFETVPAEEPVSEIPVIAAAAPLFVQVPCMMYEDGVALPPIRLYSIV